MATRFCRHIRINGERCGSPALTSEPFCYYHIEQGRRHRRVTPIHSPATTLLYPMTLQPGDQPASDPAPLQLDFPPLEDRHSIQLALSVLITALAHDRIDPKRAALLFYGLQIASSNARNLIPVPLPNKGAGKVRQTVLDEASGTLIAPDEDPEDPDESQDFQRMGSATRYLRMLELEDERAEQERLAADPNRIATPPSDRNFSSPFRSDPTGSKHVAGSSIR